MTGGSDATIERLALLRRQLTKLYRDAIESRNPLPDRRTHRQAWALTESLFFASDRPRGGLKPDEQNEAERNFLESMERRARALGDFTRPPRGRRSGTPSTALVVGVGSRSEVTTRTITPNEQNAIKRRRDAARLLADAVLVSVGVPTRQLKAIDRESAFAEAKQKSAWAKDFAACDDDELGLRTLARATLARRAERRRRRDATRRGTDLDGEDNLREIVRILAQNRTLPFATADILRDIEIKAAATNESSGGRLQRRRLEMLVASELKAAGYVRHQGGQQRKKMWRPGERPPST